jgi:hypothetical protein
MEGDQTITLWKHQAQFIDSPWKYPTVKYHFLVGGYSSGKSFSVVMLMIKIAKLYWSQPVSGILASTTISLLKKTIVADLEKVLQASKIPYKYDQNANIISIGAVKFYLLASEQPALIYGYNCSFSIVDEIDELPLEKCMEVIKAVTERTRVTFPRGKAPFLMFPSTAQGLRGLYASTIEFKEKGIPHVIIRGQTKDNLANDPSFIENLYLQYSKLEQDAFLNGMFVNLHEGRVYGEYDDTKHDVDRFEIADDETIYVGQDINTGYAKAVALVKKDCNLFVIKDFSFKSVGDIPRLLRQHFPTQKIIWVPDASSKEIMAGYAREIKHYGIQIKMAYVNPSITERIFIVNKLFRSNRLFLVRKDAKELSMALKIRQFDETGKPSKGRGSKAPDHMSDCIDIVCHRIVGFDPDFKGIWELAAPMRGNKTGEAGMRIRPEEEIFSAED